MKATLAFALAFVLGITVKFTVDRYHPTPVSAVAVALNGNPIGAVITTTDGDTNFFEPTDPKLAAATAGIPERSKGLLKLTSPTCTRPQVY